MIKTWSSPYYSFNDISIYDSGEETEAALSPLPFMQRSYFILHFILSGEGTYIIKNGEHENHIPLRAGDIFAIYPYDFVMYKSNPKKPMHYFWIDFNGNEGEKILDYLGFSHNTVVFNHKNPSKVHASFSTFFDVGKHNDKYLLLLNFFSLINVMRQGNLSITTPKHQPRKDLFVRAELYIKRHIMENIKASDIAHFLHLDRSYFSTIFKKEYNMSPYAYIMQYKLECAQNLLRSTNYSIREIADMMNFSDIYAFSSFFKKHCGISPTQYKKLKP